MFPNASVISINMDTLTFVSGAVLFQWVEGGYDDHILPSVDISAVGGSPSNQACLYSQFPPNCFFLCELFRNHLLILGIFLVVSLLVDVLTLRKPNFFTVVWYIFYSATQLKQVTRIHQCCSWFSQTTGSVTVS